MIRFLCRRGLRQFSRRYDYNTDYLDYLLQHNRSAFLKFSSIKLVSGHRAGVPAAPWFAATIRAAMGEDCGPCVQLVCNMALEAGVDAETVRGIVNGTTNKLPREVALVARFTEMTLAHDPDADTLRAEITELWGHDGLISLGFTISTSRVYPTLKYVLGHGQACSRIRIEEESVIPEKMSTGEIAI